MSSPNPKQVSIVDDEANFTAGLKFFLEQEGFAAKIFSSGEEFIEAFDGDEAIQISPQCIILDIRLGGISGTEVFYWLKSHYPDSPYEVIFLTGHGELPVAVNMVKRGAIDFLQKPVDSQRLLSVINSALASAKFRYQTFELRQIFHSRYKLLTNKEKMVMKCLLNVMSNKDIASKMDVSVRTVEIHRANVFEKLGVKNAIELTKVVEQVDLSKF